MAGKVEIRTSPLDSILRTFDIFDLRHYTVMAVDPSTSNAPPSDAARIQGLLTSMGVHDCEPGVIDCLHDFAFKYVSEILLDAEAYGEHAGKASGVVEMDDVMLAIQVRGGQTLKMGSCYTGLE